LIQLLAAEETNAMAWSRTKATEASKPVQIRPDLLPGHSLAIQRQRCVAAVVFAAPRRVHFPGGAFPTLQNFQTVAAMWSVLQPLVWLACIVAVAFAGALVLHHGPDVLHRLSWGAPAFPVIDGQTQYPRLIPDSSEVRK
jgi:hypothetical protein